MDVDHTNANECSENITDKAQSDESVQKVTVVVLGADKKKMLCQAVQDVVDAAVAKAYDGHRMIAWQTESVDGEETLGLRIKTNSSVLSLLLSMTAVLRQADYHEAANVLSSNFIQCLQSGVIPEDVALLTGDMFSNTDFCKAIVDEMDDEALFDVDAKQYDALAAKFKDELEGAMDNTVEFSKKAMEKARKKLTETGVFTEEKGEKLKEFLENDLSRVAKELKEGAKEKLNPSRLGSGALASMSKLLHKTSDALSHYAGKAEESLTCKSGEITSAGKLVCKACGYEMNFKKTGRIPPCPKCHKTEFSKGY